MLSRSISRALLLHRLRPLNPTLVSSSSSSPTPLSSSSSPSPAPPLQPGVSLPRGSIWRPFLGRCPRGFSSKRRDDGDDGGGSWKFTMDNDNGADDLIGKPGDAAATAGGLSGLDGHAAGEVPEVKKGDIFHEIEQEEFQTRKSAAASGGGGEEWETAQGYKPWGFEEDEGKGDAFQFGEEQGGLEGLGGGGMEEAEKVKAEQLEKEEQELLIKLKGVEYL